MSAPPREYLRATCGRVALRIAPAVIVLTLWFTGHTMLAAALFWSVFAVIGYLVLSPYTRLLGPVVTHTKDDNVLLTFDDGPHPDTTPLLLDLLDRHHTKAVFFVIGDRVKQWPDLAREIVRRGHTLGNHTMTHPAPSFWALGPWRTWREISACQEIVRKVTGIDMKFFRAPVGHFNFFTHPALKHLGMELMSWSARGYDGVDDNVGRVVHRIAKTMKPGAIVLLHEGRGSSVAIATQLLKSITPS